LRNRWLISGILVAWGLVWIGQGTGFFGGTGGMNGDIKWAVVGAGLIVVGALVAAQGIIRQRRV
jgi:hypothetical protein